MPAQAGIQRISEQAESTLIPACAEMTTEGSAGKDLGSNKP